MITILRKIGRLFLTFVLASSLMGAVPSWAYAAESVTSESEAGVESALPLQDQGSADTNTSFEGADETLVLPTGNDVSVSTLDSSDEQKDLPIPNADPAGVLEEASSCEVAEGEKAAQSLSMACDCPNACGTDHLSDASNTDVQEENDTAHKTAQDKKLTPKAKVGDVVSVMSDEGIRVAYHITGATTAEFGLGMRPTSNVQTLDYSYSGALTIPSTITVDGSTYTVTAVADYALTSYYERERQVSCWVSRINLPQTVTSIGYRAFAGMANMTSFVVPASVTTIGTAAFSDARLSAISFEEGSTLSRINNSTFAGTNIQNLDFLPPSVTSLGNFVFSKSAIKTAVIPAQISSLGMGCFSRCEGLTSASFAAGSPINEIPAQTFFECTALRSYSFSPSIISIESSAFRGSGLFSLTIPSTLTYMGDYVFADCASLVTVTFEQGSQLMLVNDGLFSGCTALAHIDLPQTVRSFGTKAFSGCTALASLDIPKSMERLGDFALEGCTALKTITFLGDAHALESESSTFYLSNALTTVVFKGKKATTLVYPSAVPTVYYTLSYYLSKTAVGKEEPYATYTVQDRAIPASANASQVYEGSYLENTPAGGSWAYESGFSITQEMTDSFSAYATDVQGELAVGDTFVAKTIEEVPVTYTVTDLSSGSLPGKVLVGVNDGLSFKQAISPSTTGAVTLPSTVIGSDGKTYEVSAIASHAFLNCSRIISITVPETVQSIGAKAFARCKLLRNVYFSSDASSIVDDGLFAGCTNIQRVVFGGKKANVSFGTSSPAIYYTVVYYETKHDKDIDHRLATVIVRERAFLGNLSSSDVYEGSVPSLKVGFDWVYEEGFGPDIPLVDSCKLYAEGTGFQYDIKVRNGNVRTTPCWFKILTRNEDARTGTVQVGLNKDGICAISTAVAGTPIIPGTVTDEEGFTYTVTGVGDYAFGSQSSWKACHYLHSVDLPNTITSCGRFAFAHCELMQAIALPASVALLGEGVFTCCYELNAVTFAEPSQLKAIPLNAFRDDYGLTSITLPSGITSIGVNAFADCYRYDWRTHTGEGLTSVRLPSSLVAIDERAFYNDGLLSAIDLPAHVQTIGDRAFQRCYSAQFIRFNGDARGVEVGQAAFDLRASLQDGKLAALIFMDKKSPVVPGTILSADADGNPLSFETYYCVRFYGSQIDFDRGRVLGQLVIAHDVAVEYWTDGFYSGSPPRLGEGMRWRCESGFSPSLRTHDSYYAIAGYDLSYATVTLDKTSFYYTGGYHLPTPTLTWLDGTVLIEGIDYVFDTSKGDLHNGYANNRRGPTGYVYLLGIGEYAGSVRGEFSISLQTDTETAFKIDFSQAMHYVYDGTPKTPSITVTATLMGNPYDAHEGVDYTISYVNNVNAGVAGSEHSPAVVVTGQGVFGGVYTKEFTIAPRSILQCTVKSLKAQYTLDKGPVNPDLTIADEGLGAILIEGGDYAVTYSNNTSFGLGSLRAVGMGNYQGVLVKTFSIVGSEGRGKNTSGMGAGGGSSDKATGSGTSQGVPTSGGGGNQINMRMSSGTHVAAETAAAGGGAAADSAEGGSEGYSILRLDTTNADLRLLPSFTWEWIVIVLVFLGALTVGFVRQRMRFAFQLAPFSSFDNQHNTSERRRR